ncbi:MAG TPA: hypothetical protein VGM03_02255 [Phycisphaerae bacterium]
MEHPLLAAATIEALKDFINRICRPEPFLILSVIGLAAFLAGYRKLTRPKVALTILIVFTSFYALSAFDPDFMAIIKKPDNVPITMMIYSVMLCIWLGFRQAAVNDTNSEKGLPLIEAGSDDRVLVWPDLVYTELVCLVLCSVFLMVWAIILRAPLEQPADPSVAPNPAKAPWYFLGLQELLVYFDPWIAGVLLPGLIIVGLIAVPFIDKNPRGNGYYTFKERKFAITMFLSGFLIMWVVLIIFGTFLRGPNWNFFGPYEYWDPHRPAALVNLEPKELFWIKIMGRGIPTEDVGPFKHYWIRESPGLVLLLLYFIGLPFMLYKLVFRKMYASMGLIRYVIMVELLLWMMLVPIKMVLRWTLNLHYIVGITELFFNV